MFYPNYFLLFEALIFCSFLAIVIREMRQRNFLRLFEILSCAVFGMILEIGNTHLAHTYSYSSNFLIHLAQVPLAIGFGWAVILYCAMLLSDQYNIPWTLRPFVDALTILVLDFALDVVAIRLGFWTWTIPLDAEWYGVPFENLVGWILVALSFSFLIRYIRTLNMRRPLTQLLMVASPLLAYAGLFLGLLLYSGLAVLPYQINHWTSAMQFRYNPDLALLFYPQVQLWKLIIFVVIVTELVRIVAGSLIRYRRKFLKRLDIVSFTILTVLHLFFIVAVFATGLSSEMPLLIVLSIGSLCVQIAIHLVPYLMNPKAIFLFRRVEESLELREERVREMVDAVLK